MASWKKIVAIVTVMIIAAAAYGWYLYNKKPPDVRKQPADMELSAGDLAKAFKIDETAATGNYIDKVLIVTGKVYELQVGHSGLATVFLETGDPMCSVTCSFYDDEALNINKIAAGDKIRVKGICTGILSDVVMNKCSIVY